MGIRGFLKSLKANKLYRSTALSALGDKRLLLDLSALKFSLSPLLACDCRWSPVKVEQNLTLFLQCFREVVVVKDGGVGYTLEQLKKQAKRFDSRLKSARKAGEWLLEDGPSVPRFLSRVLDDTIRATLA
ncbi:hypothetical protein KIPB_014690, partial [Kipferlia bialata]|eukprot:g14690.t1